MMVDVNELERKARNLERKRDTMLFNYRSPKAPYKPSLAAISKIHDDCDYLWRRIRKLT